MKQVKDDRDLSHKHEDFKVHRSVKIRMKKYSVRGKKHAPKARVDLEKDKFNWINCR